MIFSAKLNYARLSTRKTRLLAKLIKGKDVNTAKGILNSVPKKPSYVIDKLLKSAVVNAANKQAAVDKLYIKDIIVNEGPKLKRIFPGSRGRAEMIKKKTTHIKIILDEKSDKVSSKKDVAKVK